MDNKIPVVLSTDHNFIMPTGVCIKSMLDNAEGTTYSIYILCADSVTDSDKDVLRAIVKGTDSDIDFLKMGSDLDNAHEVRGISTATYYRLKIPWLLPQYDKVLYIDGDIIVKHGLGELYDTEMDGCFVAGVRTYGFSCNRKQIRHGLKLGVRKGEYINAGVLLINSRLWREENVYETLKPHLESKYLFQDQDIINRVFNGRIKFLPLKYNVSWFFEGEGRKRFVASGSVSDKEIEESNHDPVIIHYAGEKPWKTFTQRWWDWWDVYERSDFFVPDEKLRVAYHALTHRKSLKKQLIEIVKTILKIK